jgi:hypothetical protein
LPVTVRVVAAFPALSLCASEPPGTGILSSKTVISEFPVNFCPNSLKVVLELPAEMDPTL